MNLQNFPKKNQMWISYAPCRLCCVHVNTIFIPSEYHFWRALSFTRQYEFSILTHCRLVVDTHRLKPNNGKERRRALTRAHVHHTQRINKYEFRVSYMIATHCCRIMCGVYSHTASHRWLTTYHYLQCCLLFEIKQHRIPRNVSQTSSLNHLLYGTTDPNAIAFRTVKVECYVRIRVPGDEERKTKANNTHTQFPNL